MQAHVEEGGQEEHAWRLCNRRIAATKAALSPLTGAEAGGVRTGITSGGRADATTRLSALSITAGAITDGAERCRDGGWTGGKSFSQRRTVGAIVSTGTP